MTAPRIGSDCPDFDLPSTNGGRITKTGLAGRSFVLYLYPKDDTSGCTLEAIDFSTLLPAFNEIAVPVFGVSPDPVSKHIKFCSKHELTVPLLSDEGKVLIEGLGAWVSKSMYGRSYLGVERSTFLIDANGKIARIWTKVKVRGHAADVLDAARAHIATSTQAVIR